MGSRGWDEAVWKAGEACPPLAELLRLEEKGAPGAEARSLQAHAASCPHCSAELALFRSFERAAPSPEEQADVAWIEARVRPAARPEPAPRRAAWWRRLFEPPLLRGMALAAASLVLVVGVSLQFQRDAGPGVRTGEGRSVLRAQRLEVTTPLEGLLAPPAAIEAAAVPGAASYELRVSEVDGTPLWSGVSQGPSVPLPQEVRAALVPGRAVRVELEARDAAGAVLARSGALRLSLPGRGKQAREE